MNFVLRILLLPFTLIYSIAVRLRNFFYDIGLLKSSEFNFPLIVVGNLTVGGTGKTPHTEFIVKTLKNDYLTAVLSRGYGRKSKGYKLADSGDSPESIGDEPYQIFTKHQEILVAVDEKRKRGIEKLRALPSAPQVVVMDDAFQHRQVKAGLNILLTDYSNLYINDILLPSGRLREPKSAAKRADIIVITKSPSVLSPLEIRRITESLKPKAYQKVFFSYIDYQNLKPLNIAAN
ncbi:MAG: tetraacyldisaccharide 4'-kinase, partial [Vicingaceae bacterium]